MLNPISRYLLISNPFKGCLFGDTPEGGVEEGSQGTPLKPRQGPRPWTPLFIITIQPDLILFSLHRSDHGQPGAWRPSSAGCTSNLASKLTTTQRGKPTTFR